MPLASVMAARRPRGESLPWWQPWAAMGLFAFLLHLAWEVFQVPLYRGMVDAPHWDGVVTCTRATFGDVVITLAAYGVVAAGVRNRLWLRDPRAGRLTVFLLAGLLMTAALEYGSVYMWGRWAYAPAMPTIVGIGVAPLLQWTVLPPITLWLARRHLGWAPDHLRLSEGT